MTTNNCPTDAVLKAFHTGDLSAADSDVVSRHADGCDWCEARLTEFDGATDKFGELLRLSTKGRAAVADDVARPDYVGGYQILGEVGRGGMGVVYKARHAALNRLAAVKMILSGRYATVEDQLRFRLEAEVLGRVRHPNVVEVFEAGSQGGRPFVALEWVDGGTAERLVREGGMPARAAAELGEQVARGVHAAHSCGILHRDLKPANVLLTADGTPKVSDFGLAKVLGAGDAGGLTATGTFLGTPNYMAPEQATGKGGPAADVYGVGAVLFALLAGRPPFSAESVHDLMLAVLYQPAPSLSRLRRGVPRDLATICARCLEKNPARRYGTAAELADDLRRWLDGRPIVARPVPFWERACLAARRRPAVAALLAVAVFALTGGAAVAGWQWWEAVQARSDAENRERQAVGAQKVADGARSLAELREARRAVEKGLLMCDRWDVATGLEWLDRGRAGAERGGDADLAAVARANIAAWSGRLPVLTDTVDREPLSRVRLWFTSGCDVVAYSKSGGYVATAGNDLRIDLWKVTGGKLAEKPVGRFVAPTVAKKTAVVRCLRFSPTDEFTVAVGIGNGYAGVIDVHPDRKQQLIAKFGHPKDEVWSVAFSPDGKTLLTGCDDGIARAWPLDGGKEKLYSAGVGSAVQAVAFIPPPPLAGAGRPLLLTAGRGFGARVWREDGRQLAVVGDKKESVYSVASTWDGLRLLVLVGVDRSAQVWQMTWRREADGEWGLSEPTTLGPPIPHTHRVTAASVTPDGRVGMTADHGGTVRLWDIEGGRLLFQPVRHGDELRDAALRPDAGEVVAGGSDGLIRVWKTPPLPWSGPTLTHGSGILQAYFAPNGELITASASNVSAWGPKTRRSVWTRTGRDRATAALAVTAGPGGDGFFIAGVGSHDNVLAAPGGANPAPFPHPVQATGAVFSPDGRKLLTNYSGFMIGEPALRMWDLGGDQVSEFVGWGKKFVGRARAAAFRPTNAREILVGCASNEAVWLDADTGRAVGPPVSLPSAATAVVFRPDGEVVAVGCQDGSVRVWSAGERTPIGPGLETGESVRAVVFTPDGSGLFTGSPDGTARLWDVTTGLSLGPPLSHVGPVTQVLFSPDGGSVLTSGGDGIVRGWSYSPRQKQGKK